MVFGPGPGAGLTEATSADGRLLGIAGLSNMEVAGNLKYLADTNFRCSEPSPYRSMTKQVCSNSTTYEATVEEKTAIFLSGRAAYDASKGEATKFLGYVVRLSLEDTGS